MLVLKSGTKSVRERVTFFRCGGKNGINFLNMESHLLLTSSLGNSTASMSWQGAGCSPDPVDWDPLPRKWPCRFTAPDSCSSAVTVQSFCRSGAQCLGDVNNALALRLPMLIWSKCPAEPYSSPCASWFAGVSIPSPHIAVLTLHAVPLPAQIQATKQWLILGVLCCK